jgi:hypothetical protein
MDPRLREDDDPSVGPFVIPAKAGTHVENTIVYRARQIDEPNGGDLAANGGWLPVRRALLFWPFAGLWPGRVRHSAAFTRRSPPIRSHPRTKVPSDASHAPYL